jgi:hypothetical protein
MDERPVVVDNGTGVSGAPLSRSLACCSRLGPPRRITRGTYARLSPSLSPHPQFVKVGYAGSNFPEHVFPSIVGRPILRVEERDAAVAEIKDIMVGDEAAALRNYLQITQPMEHGIVKDFDDMRHGEWQEGVGEGRGMLRSGWRGGQKAAAHERAAEEYSEGRAVERRHGHERAGLGVGPSTKQRESLAQAPWGLARHAQCSRANG